MNIFTYGSLMYPEIWTRVVSGHYSNIRAKAEGWRRLKIAGELYPAAVPGMGSIEGIVWFDVTKQDLNALDRFEGVEYTRENCTVTTETGEKIEACIYRYKDKYIYRLLDTEWDVQDFERNGLKKFSNEYGGFADILSSAKR